MERFSSPRRGAAVDPLQPRVAQGVTGVLAIAAIALGTPWPLVAALVLVVVALLAPRYSPVSAVVRRLGPPPKELEPVAPVRFSQALAVLFLGLALVLWALGFVIAAMAVAGLVAGLAALSALTGLCVGCEVYRLALLNTRAGPDLRPALGLTGEGPWLAVLVAPGCARCAPTVRRTEQVAHGRGIVQINLAERPAASAAPVRSVPAVLAVGRSGEVLVSRAGEISDADLRLVVQALEPQQTTTEPLHEAPAPA
jgi:hypothetical protein